MQRLLQYSLSSSPLGSDHCARKSRCTVICTKDQPSIADCWPFLSLGAGNRTSTCTPFGHGLLRPACLPIPPSRRYISFTVSDGKGASASFLVNLSSKRIAFCFCS